MKIVYILALILSLATIGSNAAAESTKAKRKERDALSVDASVAVKNDAQRAIELPGVMKFDGANPRALDFTRAQEVQFTNGGTQTVYISVDQPNRIQLPFANPYVINKDAIHIEKRANSNNLYVEYLGQNNESAQIFLEPAEGGGYSIALELVPKKIPSQTVLVKDDSYQSVAERKKRGKKGTTYIQRVQDIMETAAIGGTPDGYVKTELEFPPIAMNGLMVEPAYRLSNSEFDVYYYNITNTGRLTAEVKEEEFDGDIVKAVSIHPQPYLAPGGRTAVIVLAGKHAEGMRNGR